MRRLTSKYGTPGVLAACLMMLPGAAWALGLGQIQSDTRIGQTLKARIPILAADTSSLQGLSVGLASPDTYRQSGVREPDFLFGLKFQIEQGANGAYILITSDQPVRLPFLNLLVHASWSSGEVTRQYTLLLNPPVFAAGASGAPVSEPEAPAAQTAYRPPARQAEVRQQGTPTRNLQRRYGPVQRGDTLWHIASRLAAGAGVGVNRMMIALYRANPQAFAGNINRLKAGLVLRVPARDEIEAIRFAAAAREVASQNRVWRSAQTGGGETSPTAVTSPVNPAGPTGSASGGAVSGAAAGEVVLTAPEVTEVTANAAAGAAGAGGMTGASSDETATGGKTAQAAVGPAASVGGPAKLHSEEMAKLAAAAHKTKKPPAANSFNSVSTANTGSTTASQGTLRNWLTTPKGWIVIAVILILIALVIFLFARRMRAERDKDEWEVVEPAPQDEVAVQTDAAAPGLPDSGEPAATTGIAISEVDAFVAESDVQEDRIQVTDFTFGAVSEESPVFADGMPVEEELLPLEAPASDASPVNDETGMADFYAGDALFAEAEAELEAAAADSAATAEEAARKEPDALDFDLELDQLSTEEPTHNLQDDFERTLGELSTMIETYVPEGGETPVKLQLPPEETKPAEEAGALELEPESLDWSETTETQEAGEAETESPPSAEVEEPADEQDISGTRLDLARAYLDMGDRESARDILEEVLDGGDDAQREEAQRLLETLT